MEGRIDEWAEKEGLEISGWLGSGDFGEAYETSCGRVLKVTGDLGEFAAAFRLQGKVSDHLADIYKAELTEDDHLFILMEMVDTSGVEDVFSEAMHLVEEFAFGSWEYFDEDELPDDLGASESALQMIRDVWASVFTLQQNGIDKPDINPGNIGMKHGRYVLFDHQMTEHRLYEDFKSDIRQQQSRRNSASPALSTTNEFSLS